MNWARMMAPKREITISGQGDTCGVALANGEQDKERGG